MKMQATEPVFGFQVGEIEVRTHPRSKCEGRGLPCVVHNPSEHRMRDWPLNWRGDTGVMERLCPDHGVGHPDPDAMEYEKRQGNEWMGVHGCCGCCFVPKND